MPRYKFSVIIPVKKRNQFLEENITSLLKGSYQNFEIIILPDEAPQPDSWNILSPLLRWERNPSEARPWRAKGDNKEKTSFPKTKIVPTDNVGPAEKRDIGAKIANGEILAFIDEDAYPSRDWLKKALPLFGDKNVAAVCGPGVTPPQDNILQKVSGWVNSVKIGQGPYTFRFIPEKRRYVDDFPSMNFIIRKNDFVKIGGFDTNFWPGEDTKLCLDIVKKLEKKIIYDPKVLVYHHRRPIFKEHLSQIGRYGLHRGYFAKILPETSLRLSYFFPSLLVIGLITGPFFFYYAVTNSVYFSQTLFAIYTGIVSLYLSAILLTSFSIFLQEKNLSIALLFIPAIIATHIFYGLKFIQGFIFTKKLKR